jgi:urease accessory protein
MLYFRHILPGGGGATRSITLTFRDRRRSRLRARLDDGTEVALVLARGTLLHDGDGLAADDGSVVRVRAAHELLSSAATADPLLLARAAYHLGNRHVPLQIETGRLSYEHDHVLDDLARQLGLEVTVEHMPFEPEAGSYAQGHQHDRERERDRDHDHDHDHDHDQELGHGHGHGHGL